MAIVSVTIIEGRDHETKDKPIPSSVARSIR